MSRLEKADRTVTAVDEMMDEFMDHVTGAHAEGLISDEHLDELYESATAIVDKVGEIYDTLYEVRREMRKEQ